MTLLLGKARGNFLVPQLYYKIFEGNFMRPETFGQKNKNSDKMTGKIWKTNKFGQCPARLNEKKSLGESPKTKGHVLCEQYCRSSKNVYPMGSTLSWT